jgi:hypothetical protein
MLNCFLLSFNVLQAYLRAFWVLLYTKQSQNQGSPAEYFRLIFVLGSPYPSVLRVPSTYSEELGMGVAWLAFLLFSSFSFLHYCVYVRSWQEA